MRTAVVFMGKVILDYFRKGLSRQFSVKMVLKKLIKCFFIWSFEQENFIGEKT